MGDNVIPTLCAKEIRTTRFGMAGTAAQAQTASGDQAALSALVDGAHGCDSAAHFLEIYNLVVQIRATLVANGMMKGSA